ncbi:GIY-YIG nuclease family protein [Variovorax sp. GB1P17]|uniref:GIY-YIG nuclease family protein n=1 Tax=Variovorax sp. GB1P17 TaxID=3443740 RepID=UPI003F45428A
MSNASPKTIQIFLPSGEPTGIRVAEITTRIVQLIEVPRKRLPEFFKMAESTQVGVYYLVAVPEDGSAPQVYIGQTSDLRARLAEHDNKKDFWERVLVLVSRTHSLTQTHALFLEWLSIDTARKVGRYNDLNANAGSRPHTPAPLEADCREVFETGQTLLATLGHPLFVSLPQPDGRAVKTELFYCRSGGVEGRGLYTNEGFVVLAGSVGRRQQMSSIQGTSNESFRDKLVSDGVMKIDGDTVVFARDHLFRSPSTAAVALLGRSANGWIEWKDHAGQTLDAAKRQAIGA